MAEHTAESWRELLAVCEATLEWFEHDTMVDLDELSEDAKAILNALRAVVTKARREAPA